ncbi:MAG: hypothetical protein SFY69_02750 [Planctomycetota bacterium]|nr:hypothetical protein [Planctomycetota bacterium]
MAMTALVAPGAARAQPAEPHESLPAIDIWGDFPKIDATAASPALEGAWPAREGVQGTDGLMGVIVPVEGLILKPEIRRTWSPARVSRLADDADARALFGDQLPPDTEIRSEGPGAMVLSAEAVEAGAMVPRRRKHDASLTFRFVSAQRDDTGALWLERTWFAYYEPAGAPPGEDAGAPQGGRVRGVVLLMPGMFGTPTGLLERTTNDLRARGYGVLRMLCQPSRFTEKFVAELDPSQDLDARVREVANAFDTRAAECAYAAQAALAHVHAQRPGVREAPVVAMGFSAGAITLPVVVARTPAAYAGGVVVGGGCHWWLMTELSNYREMIDAVEFRWAPGAMPADLARVREGYLRASRLDSFHAAPGLRGRAFLCVQGARDLAVPSPLGDALWERLGRPERDLVEGGHEVLFLELPKRLERIYDWIAERCPAP